MGNRERRREEMNEYIETLLIARNSDIQKHEQRYFNKSRYNEKYKEIQRIRIPRCLLTNKQQKLKATFKYLNEEETQIVVYYVEKKNMDRLKKCKEFREENRTRQELPNGEGMSINWMKRIHEWRR